MFDVLLITGVPGSGKSTVGQMIASQQVRGVYICGDELRLMVRGGFSDPAKPWDDETRQQYYLSYKNEGQLARNFITHDFRVVIDDVVHGGDLYFEWKRYFKDVVFKPILLLPDMATTLRRNSKRGKLVPELVIRKLDRDFRSQRYDDWLVIDNSKQSIIETVRVIMQSASW